MTTPPAHWKTTHANVALPPMVYGTAWKKERTAALVEQALRAGFRGIDTACQPKHYYESGVGDGIAAAIQAGVCARSDLYIQSKFTPLRGQDPANVPYDPNAPLTEQVTQSFAVSLKNLRVEQLDGLVLHSPLATETEFTEVWRALEGIHADGGARQLGISNCYDVNVFKWLWANAQVKPAILQNRFYDKSGYDVELRAFCREHGVTYQSFWTLTANPHILQHKSVVALAQEMGCAPAQILFRWLNQSGAVPLTGTTSPQHMAEDLAFTEFELTAEQMTQIAGVIGIAA
ncbi:aldo/keto reductase family protein [Magnetofaba australis]|uniref:Putative aldo/keto reductase n=1 Tax=Magnetofaba australis IT-1 TaxID=1434232 RepID=A0A1Y2KBC2_9PROT|nr:aldo/keto reductase [Magnetofaba australis]OSM07224.1 putative aldo/keto reductase [Magnetofaba australis IT-1]